MIDCIVMHSANLKYSRWAPSGSRKPNGFQINSLLAEPTKALPSRKTSAEKRQSSAIIAFQRFLKCVRRLRWKSTTLLFCHHRALNQQTDNVIHLTNFPIASDNAKANAAEINFKLDFFEYYGLLERTIVNLLECFSIVISADYTSDNVPLPMTEPHHATNHQNQPQQSESSIIGDSVAFYGYAHRFHANVLFALDRNTNPLHTTLGVGKVRQYLGLAKEFRNRWKEAELEDDSALDIPKPYHKMLSDLRLDEMLETILSALEQSRLLAMAHLASSHPTVEVDMINIDDDPVIDAIEMDDAMDWD